MNEREKPHLEYLGGLYSEVLDRGRFLPPLLHTDRLGELRTQYGEADHHQFDAYFKYLRRHTDYFTDHYDKYSERFTTPLPVMPLKAGKAVLLWTMAVTAYGEQHLASIDNSVKGPTAGDIIELGLIYKKYCMNVAWPLGSLVSKNVITSQPDPTIEWIDKNGATSPFHRYQIAQPPIPDPNESLMNKLRRLAQPNRQEPTCNFAP